MELNDTEWHLVTTYTEDQLRDWLDKSEDTGHYNGYSRHSLAIALIDKMDANKRMNEFSDNFKKQLRKTAKLKESQKRKDFFARLSQ